ncbi:hypothetical protein A2U01_0045540 [Trifolium medium]|uniref:Uncharacterized protein n=1 Tax=Trifolium medium TaxID=97028 RepID=A0A392QKC0_9FABA|nr:hypothetical protein [Trifolium medium]
MCIRSSTAAVGSSSTTAISSSPAVGSTPLCSYCLRVRVVAGERYINEVEIAQQFLLGTITV